MTTPAAAGTARRRPFAALARGLTAAAVALAVGLGTLPAPARADASELRVARQYGLGYLQLMLMDDQKLIEKHAKAAGLGEIKVTWATFRSSDVMNDALLSGSVDFVCLGLAGIGVIWGKTRGNIDVRAASGLNALPLFLNTRNPAVKTIRDFTDADRIALPAVRVSMQALLLQMAAEQAFGPGQHTRLDKLTVSMAHPDGVAALLAGKTEITAHFTSPPFQYRELKDPAVRKILSSTDILGGKFSFNVVATTAKFRAANPKLYAAFLAALEDATAQINADKRAAAEAYKRIAKDQSPVEDILAIMTDPEAAFTTDPLNLMKVTDFLHKVGTIKVKPGSWKDLFFENMHDRPGS